MATGAAQTATIQVIPTITEPPSFGTTTTAGTTVASTTATAYGTTSKTDSQNSAFNWQVTSVVSAPSTTPPTGWHIGTQFTDSYSFGWTLNGAISPSGGVQSYGGASTVPINGNSGNNAQGTNPTYNTGNGSASASPTFNIPDSDWVYMGSNSWQAVNVIQSASTYATVAYSVVTSPRPNTGGWFNGAEGLYVTVAH